MIDLTAVDEVLPILKEPYGPWIVGAAWLFLAVGALLLGREWTRRTGGSSDDASAPVVRAWVAIGLVGGLLILTTASFFGTDSQLRSLLVGGVVSSAGTAVAFYFASRGSEKTQQNLLTAAFSTTVPRVPEITSMDQAQAEAVLKAVGYRYKLGSAGAVDHTDPAIGTSQLVGTEVTVYGP